ncbi:hypothetical protein C8Q79DRAFT_1012775 [Trametes meyenii]|nr:hypothetical protein C8Q79DRAFT_1012775 [Trametes meyenii]
MFSVDGRDFFFPSPFVFQERTPATLKVQGSAVAKWRSEMVEQDREVVEQFWGGEERLEIGHGEKQWPRETITPAQLDYIFNELCYEAQAMDKKSGIYAGTVPMVYGSQYLIPPALTTSLLEGVSVVETVSEEKDWHPDSDGQVLDLVHPSLYFLRIGHTHVINKSQLEGLVDTRAITEEEYMCRPDLHGSSPELERELWALSNKFQWLPTDFRVSPTGDVSPLVDVNNLHPIRHRSMDPVLSSILGRFVPPLESVLSAALSPPRKHAIDPPFRIPLPSSHLTRRLKIAACHRPSREKPEYPGGSWHVEGTTNFERIVGTGLYYCACKNISELRLAFCAMVGSENLYAVNFHEQDDHKGCLMAYGFRLNSDLNQTPGHIVVKVNAWRFPPYTSTMSNLSDWRIQPGQDIAKFCVSPSSTSDVPPQQEDRWNVELMGSVITALPQRLPQELYDAISDDTRRSGTISIHQEAVQLRERFMDERSDLSSYHSYEVFRVRYNMCEH